MNKDLRGWLLARDEAAGPRLEDLRRTAVLATPASPAEMLRELFRPCAGAWAALALAWIVLGAAHAAYRESARGGPRPLSNVPTLPNFDITQNDALSALDPHS